MRALGYGERRNRCSICEGCRTGSPPNCITRNNGSPTLRFEDDKVEDDVPKTLFKGLCCRKQLGRDSLRTKKFQNFIRFSFSFCFAFCDTFCFAFEVGFGFDGLSYMFIVKHLCLHGFKQFGFYAAYAKSVAGVYKNRVVGFGNFKRALRQELQPIVLAGSNFFPQLNKIRQVYYNIPILGENRLCPLFLGAVFDIVFAIDRPSVLENFFRLEYAEIAKPNEYR